MDLRFALLAGLAQKSLYGTRLNLVEVYPPFVGGQRAYSARYWLYRLLLSTMDAVFVHSRFEVRELALYFGLSEARFRFVPYFPYYDATKLEMPDWETRWQDGYVLCPGRHRDHETFVAAAREIPRKCVIVTGRQEGNALSQQSLPSNVELCVEVPAAEYYGLFTGAAVVVLPLAKAHYLRSLGQIAYFEAARHQTPVVMSRSPQLTDYVREGQDALCYAPGDARELAFGVNRILQNNALGKYLAASAQTYILDSFSHTKYVRAILDGLA